MTNLQDLSIPHSCTGAINESLENGEDEQTLGFQGQHADKLRITHKGEGDGFQCDAL